MWTVVIVVVYLKATGESKDRDDCLGKGRGTVGGFKEGTGV